MQQHLRWRFAGRGRPEHLFDDLVLCVSELVTTAVEVAATSILLSLDSSADAIRLAMIDRSPDSAAATRMQAHGTNHRARIIDAVATRWGVARSSDGDEIWVEFALGSAGHRGGRTR